MAEYLTTTKRAIVNELHRPARKHFPRRRIIIKGLDDTWQADLIDLVAYSRDNKGHKYILVVIDNFSKFVWTEPLKTKSAEDVSRAFAKILNGHRQPKNLQTDDGKEFFNSKFHALMEKYGINHYKTYSIIKAAIVERVIRTLKNKLFKTFNLYGSYKWIDKINDITNEYNNTRHRTIGMRPKDVDASKEKHLLNTVYSHIKTIGKQKFKVDDVVRISKYKHVFNKGYTPNWTTELFKIDRVRLTNPTVYLLKDMRGNPVHGGFYAEELQKTRVPDEYLVEKVLKKRVRNKTKEIFVKWLGFPSTENQWIPASNVT